MVVAPRSRKSSACGGFCERAGRRLVRRKPSERIQASLQLATTAYLPEPMSRNYRILDPDGLYFVSFATVGWVDLLTRREYKDVVLESLKHCQVEKGLLIYEWVIMTSHVHLLVKADGTSGLSDILRDLKKYTSKQLINALEHHPQESRREWLLKMFREAGERNSNNTTYQVWQQHNKPLLLERTEEIDRVTDYIRENPVVEGFVASPEDYLYSSAHDARLLRLEEA